VNTILGVVFVWVALPIIAALAIVTLIGLPLGLGVLIFLLPALWFLGLIVAGTRLGLAIVKVSGRESGEHPYLASFVGLLILQLHPHPGPRRPGRVYRRLWVQEPAVTVPAAAGEAFGEPQQQTRRPEVV
jgi:hypothetical protein